MSGVQKSTFPRLPLPASKRKREKKVKNPLTPQRAVFLREYIASDFNGAQAAINAGYSKSTARVMAAQIMADPTVQREFTKLLQARFQRVELSADRILEELQGIAYFNPMDFMEADDKGHFILDASKVSRKHGVAISEIIVDQAGGGAGDGQRQAVLRTRFKFYDKLKALELLGKHLKMFVEKIEHTVGDEVWDRLARGRQRALEAHAEAIEVEAHTVSVEGQSV